MPAAPAETPVIPQMLRLLKARELAEQGRLREAETMLAGAESPSADPDALHTLAVIVTRQGDHERARRLWQRLAQARPGDAEAERMIEAIDVWEERPAWMVFAPAAAVALLLVVGALIFWPRGEAVARQTPVPIQPVVVTGPATPVRVVPAATAPAQVRTAPTSQAASSQASPMVTFELPPAKPKR